MYVLSLWPDTGCMQFLTDGNGNGIYIHIFYIHIFKCGFNTVHES